MYLGRRGISNTMSRTLFQIQLTVINRISVSHTDSPPVKALQKSKSSRS